MMRDKIVRLILTFLGLYSLVEGFDLYRYPEYYDDIDTNVRILNGEIANVEDFPYVVKLEIHSRRCTGSIISYEWIITAGHCLYKRECAGIKIYPAVWPSSKFIEPVECIIHPGYEGHFVDVDLGLLKLPKNCNQDKSIGVIPLQPPGTLIPEGSVAVTAGFGRTEDYVVPGHLLQAEVTVVKWSMCNDLYQLTESKQNPNWDPINLPQSILCTEGHQSKPGGTCTGDSGGPVIINGFLVGVISLVYLTKMKKCVVGTPATHVSVVHHLPWIHSHISPGTRAERILNGDYYYL